MTEQSVTTSREAPPQRSITFADFFESARAGRKTARGRAAAAEEEDDEVVRRGGDAWPQLQQKKVEPVARRPPEALGAPSETDMSALKELLHSVLGPSFSDFRFGGRGRCKSHRNDCKLFAHGKKSALAYYRSWYDTIMLVESRGLLDVLLADVCCERAH